MRSRKQIAALVAAALAVSGLLIYGLLQSDRELAGFDGLRTEEAASTTAPIRAKADWQKGAEFVSAGLNDLFMNPDPARVDEFVDPECECYDQFKELLRGLAEKGERYDRATAELVKTRLLDHPAPGEARVVVTLRSPAPRLLDRNGDVIQTLEEFEGDAEYVLRRSPSGQWRLLDRPTQPG